METKCIGSQMIWPHIIWRNSGDYSKIALPRQRTQMLNRRKSLTLTAAANAV